MSQGHHLLLLKLMTNELWKVASRAALIRTVRGKLSVWNVHWDARLNNVCLAMTLKSARLTTFPIWCNLLSPLVKMHMTATACIVCHVVTMKPRLSHASLRETYFSPCLYPVSNLSSHLALEFCPSAMPQPSCTLEKGDDGAIPCTRVSALFSLGSSLLVKNQLKQNKGYELPSS